MASCPCTCTHGHSGRQTGGHVSSVSARPACISTHHFIALDISLSSDTSSHYALCICMLSCMCPWPCGGLTAPRQLLGRLAKA